MLKRHQIQVLRQAGHSQQEVALLADVSRRSVQRVDIEVAVTHLDIAQERERRGVGRPAKAEAFRTLVAALLMSEPDVLSVEILRRAKLAGYRGGKTTLYDLIRTLRPATVRPLVRFEGLAGEFSQHDFGEVEVRFLDGRTTRVHFFASRLKYSRWVEVSVVADEQAETLVRALVGHFAAIGIREDLPSDDESLKDLATASLRQCARSPFRSPRSSRKCPRRRAGRAVCEL
jgi:hypothetical protein